jgi:hypothetical protein
MQISEAEKEYVQAEFIKEKRICFQELWENSTEPTDVSKNCEKIA